MTEPAPILTVDATYRADLGELNKVNFARFDRTDPSLALCVTAGPSLANLRWPSARQQVLRSRAFRALPQDDNAARRLGEREGGGWFLSLPGEAREPVILSAAGAKDLLSHRCEGPVDAKDR